VIDFRYHLVSIVAVFLALAIGIVLGSTELQGPVYSALSHTTTSLEGKLSNAENQAATNQQDLNADNQMLSLNEAWDVRDMLDGQRVIIVTEPNAEQTVITGVQTALKDAGATVTGQINLQQKFFDSSDETASLLEATNAQIAANDSISLDSSLSDQQQATAQVLAAEILTKSASGGAAGQTSAGQTTSTSQLSQANTALQAYATQGFLNTSGQPATQATLAVVVTPQTIPADGTADPLAQVLGPFAQELASASSGAVVVGTAAASGVGSPIAELRATSAANQVSSVDDADSSRGPIETVDALYSTLTGHGAVSYGITAGQYPSVSPSVSPSPASTPSSSSSTSSHKPHK
jgi:hypothetical protein